jgi:hypothetical protein
MPNKGMSLKCTLPAGAAPRCQVDKPPSLGRGCRPPSVIKNVVLLSFDGCPSQLLQGLAEFSGPGTEVVVVRKGGAPDDWKQGTENCKVRCGSRAGAGAGAEVMLGVLVLALVLVLGRSGAGSMLWWAGPVASWSSRMYATPACRSHRPFLGLIMLQEGLLHGAALLCLSQPALAAGRLPSRGLHTASASRGNACTCAPGQAIGNPMLL